MNRIIVLFLFFCIKSFSQNQEYIEREGDVTFFSYTSVENINAKNTKTLSIFNPQSGNIAVRILMRAFVFEKTLMHEHFNESYIESDLYPEATFEGLIDDFDTALTTQTKIIKGTFKLRGIEKPLEFKANISKTNIGYNIEGDLEVLIDDYDIKVPALLSPNISKKIKIAFNFKYDTYEK
ncbi:YceI family protein [Hyunsoonleella sp. 2307UL5-6]|uniref:YceI family protein n=1 Tax=Hyunsoonleella sp. 2307UL5-6 TaxID=3384768 RepID=UPI0039BD2E0F